MPDKAKINWPEITDESLFPEAVAGKNKPNVAWEKWEAAYKTTYYDYIKVQVEKEKSIIAVNDSMLRLGNYKKLSRQWLSALKLHGALLPLAEFAAVIGNMRAARFARDSNWRDMALIGALDELRHTQIPLRLNHFLVRQDKQFDWTHKFYHSNNWIAIAARHCFDEMLHAANPIEFAIATNFVFENGFTNLQFIGLAALGAEVGDGLFEEMVSSIQTDEARHAQIGTAVLDLLADDKEEVQRMVDKWFWRSWRLFAIATGISTDYFTPIEHRKTSFKEFMQEWVIRQFQTTLDRYGLKRPWYWNIFEEELDYFHHMAYASAYSYRASTWFDQVLPSPQDLEWLRSKYPGSWPKIEPIWQHMIRGWQEAVPGLDFAVHGSAIMGFCNLCQVVLCGGTPQTNTTIVEETKHGNHIFCSAPCQYIYNQEPERYGSHADLVTRVLEGKAPGNLLAMLTQYMNLHEDEWGKDVCSGDYPWLERKQT